MDESAVLSLTGIVGSINLFMMLANAKLSRFAFYEAVSWLLPLGLGVLATTQLPVPGLAGQPMAVLIFFGLNMGLSAMGSHAMIKKAKKVKGAAMFSMPLLLLVLSNTGCAAYETAKPKLLDGLKRACDALPVVEAGLEAAEKLLLKNE